MVSIKHYKKTNNQNKIKSLENSVSQLDGRTERYETKTVGLSSYWLRHKYIC